MKLISRGVRAFGLFWWDFLVGDTPELLVAVVASTTLDRGLDRFFSTRTHAMIEQSLIVADAYVSEHAASIRSQTISTPTPNRPPSSSSNTIGFARVISEAASRSAMAAMKSRRAWNRTICS